MRNKASRRFTTNRLQVPSELRDCEHFLYKTKAVKFNQKETNYILKCVKQRYASIYQRQPSQVKAIQAFSKLTFLEYPKEYDCERISAILDGWQTQLASPLDVRSVDKECDLVEIVVCPWVSLHDDYDWAKQAFYSTVIHTGPYPYILQTAHVDRRITSATERAITGVVETRRRLEVGEAFIFDPTTAHMAAPETLHQDQLLIFVQRNLKDATLKDRAAIIKHFPQREDDRSCG